MHALRFVELDHPRNIAGALGVPDGPRRSLSLPISKRSRTRIGRAQQAKNTPVI
jgi:hypothetical protein